MAVLNVSTLLGVRTSRSDALRYGLARDGEATPVSAASRRPVIVWNCTRGCNLACAHCYASATARPRPDELSTVEARAFLADLAAFDVPAVLLSGGEPLTRPDLDELLGFGTDLGLRFTISTNGTLVDAATATRLADAGVTYAGVSIDGPAREHDRLRRQAGAHDAAVAGLQRLAAAGVRRGVRFTLTPDTVGGLDAVLHLVMRERVERLCVYHLVPQGRGARLDDLAPATRRAAIETVFAFAAAHPEVEVLTVDNPSDGVLLCRWLADRDPAAARRARAALAWNTGARAGSGLGLACVTERGDVHPDQFSRHRVLGNVRVRPFSEIWSEPEDEYARALRDPDRGRPPLCEACDDYDVCGGGFRVRAESATGDPWGDDPSCHLRGGPIVGAA